MGTRVPIAIYFHPQNMTVDKYDEVIRRLEAAGEGRPKARLYHSCFGPEHELMVYDVWESPETFEVFGQTLLPILADLGVDVGEPQVMAIHNMID